MHRKRSTPNMGKQIFNITHKQLITTLKHPSTSTFTVTILFKDNKGPLEINVPKNSRLKTLKDAIFQQLKQILTHSQYALVIGLQTTNQDYQIEYQLQKGLGDITSNLTLTCLMKSFAPQGKSILKYKICRLISTGGFSKVYLLRDLISGQFKIGKFILKEGADKNLIKQEHVLSSSFKHPFIVLTYQMIEMPHFYVIVMDYYPGGQLFELLKQNRFMAQDNARFYITEVLLALKELHSKSIIYRDIKPENVLLDIDGHIRLVDFGLAKKIKEKTFSFCGSLDYMAPEMINESGHSFEADFYSIGNLLYQILIGAPPFYHPKYCQEQTKYHIKNTEARFPQQLQLSAEVIDLLKRLLCKIPSQRLGFEGGIDEILRHKWFQCVEEEDYITKLIQPPITPTLKMNFDLQQDQEHLHEYKRMIDMDIKHLMKRGRNNSNLCHDKQRNSLNSHKSCDQYHPKQSPYNMLKSPPSHSRNLSLIYLLSKRKQHLKLTSKQRKSTKTLLTSNSSAKSLNKINLQKKSSISKIKSYDSNSQTKMGLHKQFKSTFFCIGLLKVDKQNHLRKTGTNKKFFKKLF